MAGGDHEDGELGERAIAYAELAVEGVRMVSWDLVDAFMAQVGLPAAVPAAPHPPAAQIADMNQVKRLIATAFVMGWEARDEEPRRRARALGGVGEAATRRARHGERRPRRRPVED